MLGDDGSHVGGNKTITWAGSYSSSLWVMATIAHMPQHQLCSYSFGHNNKWGIRLSLRPLLIFAAYGAQPLMFYLLTFFEFGTRRITHVLPNRGNFYLEIVWRRRH